MNSTLNDIEKRHSIRSFTDQPISENDLTTILKAANQAPSAHNQQSWRFVVVRGEKKNDLASLVHKRASDFPKASSALLRMAARSIKSAPVVVAVVNTGELIRHGSALFKLESDDQAFDFFRTMEIQSSAAAVQNMLLAATAIGLSTVWLGVLFLIKDEIIEFFGEPEGEFMAVVPVGYAAKDSPGPGKRPLDVLVKVLE